MGEAVENQVQRALMDKKAPKLPWDRVQPKRLRTILDIHANKQGLVLGYPDYLKASMASEKPQCQT